MSQDRPKRRDIHPETGLWYWGIIKGRETWLTEEKFESYRLRVNAASAARQRKVKKDSDFHEKVRPKIGTFNQDTGLYFLRMSGVNEQWVTKDKVDSFRRHKLEVRRKSRAENPEKYKAMYQKYISENKEKERERCRLKMAKARADNKDDFKKRELRKKNARCRERTLNEPAFAMKMRALFSLNRAFKQKGFSKSGNSEQLLGCSWEELKAHIENQFSGGMCWENRGEWHVDHIIPLSSGKTVEEVMVLCHYKNLQPLWALDNLRKGNRIP
jgi:hypothetical protein